MEGVGNSGSAWAFRDYKEYQDETRVFKPADHTDFADYSEDDMFRKGTYAYGISNSFSYEGSLNLAYHQSFGKHLLVAGVDVNLREGRSRSSSFKAEGFTNENFDDISSALQYEKNGKPSGAESTVRSVGFTEMSTILTTIVILLTCREEWMVHRNSVATSVSLLSGRLGSVGICTTSRS